MDTKEPKDTLDLMGEMDFGKAALAKLSKKGPLPAGFRIYAAGWMGDSPDEFEIMKVTGAEFREAKTGKNKGKLSIMVPGTIRNVFVTIPEMEAFR